MNTNYNLSKNDIELIINPPAPIDISKFLTWTEFDGLNVNEPEFAFQFISDLYKYSIEFEIEKFKNNRENQATQPQQNYQWLK